MTLSAANQTDFLRTILNLETKNGFADRAVIGGLDNYIRKWSADYLQGPSGPGDNAKFKALLSNQNYTVKNRAQREQWVKEVLYELEHLPSKGKAPASAPRKSAARTAKPAPQLSSEEGLDESVAAVKGIGDSMAKRLAKLGVYSVRDLIYFFPRRFMDFSKRTTVSALETGKFQTIFVNVWEARGTMFGRMRGSEAVLGDETGNIRAVWFNQPWVGKQLKTNSRIAVSGRVTEFNYRKVFENPEWELIEDKELMHTGRLVPVYQLTQSLYPRQVRSVVKNALDTYLGRTPEFLPDAVRQRCGLIGLQQALMQAHYPVDYASQAMSRKRLAFDELFLLQLGVLDKKREWQEDQPGHGFHINNESLQKFVASLPFALTEAQQRVVYEICADLSRDIAMSRLLQGDVGSGKTVVATIALLAAVENGYQGALMAPTEILAAQHFATLFKLLSAGSGQSERHDNIYTFKNVFSVDIKVALLMGSTKEKAEIYDKIHSGEVNIVIGTHALIQKGVHFRKLGLAIIDEQHRFGVLQRTALRQKGFNPHLLVMTATPIPRTLALTLYGDLDISTINQMPPGRQPIKTRWLVQNDRDRAYNFIRKQVREGRQAFIICPLIEESENLDVKAAVAEYERLSSEVFSDLRLGLLHGKMKGPDKEDVMSRFKAGELDVLVSTSVVEVGIDVPNATIMLVEAADRFGLAQLHQFRGRVGRGQQQSYCLLLSEHPSEYGQERLKAIEEINDGFALAEKDLELRGPGEFFGTRQSGLPDLKMARLSDTQLLEVARREARMLFEKDSGFQQADHRLLAMEFNRIWHKRVENN